MILIYRRLAQGKRMQIRTLVLITLPKKLPDKGFKHLCCHLNFRFLGEPFPTILPHNIA